jgi:hypothetical protein
MSGSESNVAAWLRIRVDSKVVAESDSGEAKNDEVRWMQLTLDTVGKITWPAPLSRRLQGIGRQAGA